MQWTRGHRNNFTKTLVRRLNKSMNGELHHIFNEIVLLLIADTGSKIHYDKSLFWCPI